MGDGCDGGVVAGGAGGGVVVVAVGVCVGCWRAGVVAGDGWTYVAGVLGAVWLKGVAGIAAPKSSSSSLDDDELMSSASCGGRRSLRSSSVSESVSDGEILWTGGGRRL